MIIEQNSRGTHPLESIVCNIKPPDSEIKIESGSTVSRIDLQTSPVSLPKLSFASLRAPAIFINNDLNIIWQNKLAMEEIWHHTPMMRNTSEPTSVFQIIFNANFQSLVENWRPWAVFFLKHGIDMSSRKHVDEVIETQSERCIGELRLLTADLAHSNNGKGRNERISQIQTRGTTIRYQVTSVDFTEGQLLIFNEDKTVAVTHSFNRLSDHEKDIDARDKDTEPVEKPIYFIAARLSNAEALQIEMLPGEHSQLLSHIWKNSVETIEQFGGMVVDIKANSLLGLFISEDLSDDEAMNVIQCALELKSMMNSTGRQWKNRSGWQRHLELNLGIHHCDEYVGSISTGDGNCLTTFGNGRQTVARLAAVAANGEIWASKDLFKKLSPDALQRVQFGVFRSENQRRRLIEHGFDRICNLSRNGLPTDDNSRSFSPMIATQIFDNLSH